jgi:hypothetical protein
VRTRRGAATDADAADYFARIVSAGSTISANNQAAVNAFIVGCKADGIWTAIKAACFLAGPDDLAGALVPLVGTAPTNGGGNFVSGDYNRTTGLVGNASTKYLNSNRNNNADPQDSQHLAAWTSFAGTNGYLIAHGLNSPGTSMLPSSTLNVWRSRQAVHSGVDGGNILAGFTGLSRSGGSNYTARKNATNTVINYTSEAPASGDLLVFARGAEGSPASLSDARIAFYSIGEALDLAALDARLATYMASIT